MDCLICGNLRAAGCMGLNRPWICVPRGVCGFGRMRSVFELLIRYCSGQNGSKLVLL